MSYTDTPVGNLIINKLTKEQYDSLEEKSETELYIITDEIEITNSVVSDIQEKIPSNASNSNKLVTNSDLSDTCYTKEEIDGMIGDIQEILESITGYTEVNELLDNINGEEI